MSKIAQVFKNAKSENRAVLIPYITAGFPNLKASQKIIEAVAQSGAGILEIGLPFSDPLADGPTIQKSSQVALEVGTDTKIVFELIKKLRKKTDIPIVIMTYYNLFYKYGLKRFASDAKKAGVDGVIIPDLPVEEAKPWLEASKGKLDTIFLVAPTSSDARIRAAAKFSTGFIYCVSLTGTTGARTSLPKELPQFVARVRKVTNKPIAVGFGVSDKSQAAEVAKIADGVIIGSAFINQIDKANQTRVQVDNVVKFADRINKALQKD